MVHQQPCFLIYCIHWGSQRKQMAHWPRGGFSKEPLYQEVMEFRETYMTGVQHQGWKEWGAIMTPGLKGLGKGRRWPESHVAVGREPLGRRCHLRWKDEDNQREVIRTWKLSLWSALTLQAPAAAKSLQSCPTLCNPIDGSPPGSSVPGILQAGTLEWVAISFSSARKWKVKVKSLSHVWLLATPVHAIFQAKEYWSEVPVPSPGTSHLSNPVESQRERGPQSIWGLGQCREAGGWVCRGAQGVFSACVPWRYTPYLIPSLLTFLGWEDNILRQTSLLFTY